jgi:hypothetical protein
MEMNTGDMGLAVPYRPPTRPKIVPLSVPFRVFQQFFTRKEHSVPYKEFFAGLKRFPDAADSLGLMSWVKESNASLQIFQLLFGVEEFDEEKHVTLGDLFRTFSGHEIEDLAVDLPYEREAAHERPPLISAKAAIAAFNQAGGSMSAFITHGDLMDAMKNDLALAKTLGFLKPMKEEDGTHTIARIMLAPCIPVLARSPCCYSDAVLCCNYSLLESTLHATQTTCCMLTHYMLHYSYTCR